MENTQARRPFDEDTQLEGARKRERKQGSYGSLEFCFHKDYPIGAEGLDDLICLRVLRSRRALKTEDWRTEIVRKELRGDRLVAIYRGHPNVDSAQLQFIDEHKLLKAIEQAKADMAYDQHKKEQNWNRRPRRPRSQQPLQNRMSFPKEVMDALPPKVPEKHPEAHTYRKPETLARAAEIAVKILPPAPKPRAPKPLNHGIRMRDLNRAYAQFDQLLSGFLVRLLRHG